MNKANKITVFEHEKLKVGDLVGNVEYTRTHHSFLEKFFKEKEFPYYKLLSNGVQFCEYVGVIQLGKLIIEILPKADKNENKEQWRKMLIDMLKAVNFLNTRTPSSSSLKLKPNSILDIYIELFISKCEQLLRLGLIKHYHKIEENTTALKGKISFAKNIQVNITHKEKFYVKHTVYDIDYSLNRVLYKTLRLINQINSSENLKSKINSLVLNFPELPDIKVNKEWFNKIPYTRKSEPYRQLMKISELLLLNYHPDIVNGKDDVLALMFDMNMLWEKFVIDSLKKHNINNYLIKGKSKKYFWKKEFGNRICIIPDIVVSGVDGINIVLDTKWKTIGNDNPGINDLRQMYVYSKYYNNANVALIYPGIESNYFPGFFIEELDNTKVSGNACGIFTVKVNGEIRAWQRSIANQIFNQKI